MSRHTRCTDMSPEVLSEVLSRGGTFCCLYLLSTPSPCAGCSNCSRKCCTLLVELLTKLVIDESVKNSWEFSGASPAFHHSFPEQHLLACPARPQGSDRCRQTWHLLGIFADVTFKHRQHPTPSNAVPNGIYHMAPPP